MYAQALGCRNFSKIECGTDGAPMDGVSAMAHLSRVRLVQPRVKACLLLKLEFTNEPELLEDGGISWFVCAREKRPLGKVCVLVSLRVLSILPWDERTGTSGGDVAHERTVIYVRVGAGGGTFRSSSGCEYVWYKLTSL